ncbi:Retrovirus-related Pol polyprotein from transposon TNT 1-94 [Trichinella murrelli]|uniref:Retrovirus-related Pol polyprotein from transposon TNT 1-94 n=1 Tax=Trichinella murrelli TaxID=144512 RepID=A0A0V0TKG8_9BILA|nr:Retrovirus-related Pol polyprotein from transposon TNT 1-94 [Trichinella murrelli]
MLDDTLRSFGLNRLKNEPCIYFLWKNKIFLAVGVYVDDLLILSNNESSKNELKMALWERFKMKDLGKAHWCLGIRIVQDVENGTLSIDQEQYIEELLHQFRMSDCKGVKTPLDPNQVLSKAMMPRSDKEIKQMHAVPYREAVGCLIYLSQSCRPDICHAVGIVSRFSDNPGKAHWTAVKRIFQYLNDCMVIKKQRTVALSTTEAEYMALSQAAQESAWLRSLQSELEKETSKPTLLCNNSGAVSISIESEIEMRQIPSADNAVDMFTKAMTPSSPAACVKLTGMEA